MNIVYIQDQEIAHLNGHYYHSKSESFFSRYLCGLNESEHLIVYAGIRESTSDKVVKFKDITNPKIEYRKLPEFRKLKNLPVIYKLVEEIVKDVDFCYLRTGIAASIASMYCRKKGIPYMAIVNEDVYNNTKIHSNFIVRMSAVPLLFLNKRMIEEAQYACYVTQTYLQQKYPCKGKSLGCSDVEFLKLDDNVVEARISKIKKNKGNIKLGTIGAVSTILKGQDTVIRALAKLKNSGINNYEYHLVGTGDQKRLKKLADALGVSNCIYFHGAFNHDDVMTWFNDIDIYIHPSHSEGLPRTIIEAMTMACPCICTSVGGVPELIGEEFLFSYNGKEIYDLVKILRSMDEVHMIQQAIINYERSKQYDPYILDQRRKAFFVSALSNVRSTL